jgi:hypothetical protein
MIGRTHSQQESTLMDPARRLNVGQRVPLTVAT